MTKDRSAAFNFLPCSSRPENAIFSRRARCLSARVIRLTLFVFSLVHISPFRPIRGQDGCELLPMRGRRVGATLPLSTIFP